MLFFRTVVPLQKKKKHYKVRENFFLLVDEIVQRKNMTMFEPSVNKYSTVGNRDLSYSYVCQSSHEGRAMGRGPVISLRNYFSHGDQSLLFVHSLKQIQLTTLLNNFRLFCKGCCSSILSPFLFFCFFFLIKK